MNKKDLTEAPLIPLPLISTCCLQWEVTGAGRGDEVREQVQMVAPLVTAVEPPWQCKYPCHRPNN